MSRVCVKLLVQYIPQLPNQSRKAESTNLAETYYYAQLTVSALPLSTDS